MFAVTISELTSTIPILTIGEVPATAIKDLPTKTITKSVNPSSYFIHLSRNSGLIRIYDLKGSLVLSQKTNNQNVKLVKK